MKISDSAAGSIAKAVDREWQAIFPLRGKILNTIGMKPSRILQNQELNHLLVAIFGTNDLNKIKAEDSRFSRVILLSDSDDDGLHINSLLVNFFFGFLRELFVNQNIYIGLPPKYSYQDSKGKFFYIQNDDELADFEYSQVDSGVTILNEENINLKDLMSVRLEYERVFSNIRNQYSISSDLLSRFLIPNEEDEYLEDIVESVGLEYNEGHITGIYHEEWHDFFEDAIFDELETIGEVYEFFDKINFTYRDKEYEMYPIDFYTFISEKYQFKYNYFKGLGEASSDELFDTTIGPNRSLIQLNLADEKATEELMDNLFKSSETSARRDLMRTYLN